MKLHGNAKLSLKGGALLVERVESAGWSLPQAGEAARVSDRTATKWLSRSRAEGPEGLLDRSSAPMVVANRTDEQRLEVIAALLRRAVRHYQAHSITIERLITDNGSAYRSTIHAIACRRLRIHIRTPPHRPQTNGKAERLIRTPAGPAAPSPAQAPNATPRPPAGSRPTTPDDRTEPSATSRPPLASTS